MRTVCASHFRQVPVCGNGPAKLSKRPGACAATTDHFTSRVFSHCGRDAGAVEASKVTLTTQCSLDRWPRFQQQAESWGGPVSVAVYIPSPQHTSKATAGLQLLQQWAEEYATQHPRQQLQVAALFANHFAREGASALSQSGLLDAASTQEPPDSSTTAAAAPAASSAGEPPRHITPYEQLYPINALRNLALQQASTPLVLPVDADFVLSEGLECRLHAPDPGYSILDTHVQGAEGASVVDQLLLSTQQQQQQQPHRPLILLLPAFQLVQPTQQQQQSGQAEQLIPDSECLIVPKTKPELLQALQQGSVRPFDCGVFAPKQQPLDLTAWCAAVAPLEVAYFDLFEVHGGVALQQQLPLYSEAFRGYGLNKQQHAWHAAALGFGFKVLPDVFMVTAPHKHHTSWRPQSGTAADEAHLQRISAVYTQFKQQLAQQGLSPPTAQ